MNKAEFILKACKDRNLIYTPPTLEIDEVQAEKLKFIDLQNCISDGLGGLNRASINYGEKNKGVKM